MTWHDCHWHVMSVTLSETGRVINGRHWLSWTRLKCSLHLITKCLNLTVSRSFQVLLVLISLSRYSDNVRSFQKYSRYWLGIQEFSKVFKSFQQYSEVFKKYSGWLWRWPCERARTKLSSRSKESENGTFGYSGHLWSAVSPTQWPSRVPIDPKT